MTFKEELQVLLREGFSKSFRRLTGQQKVLVLVVFLVVFTLTMWLTIQVAS